MTNLETVTIECSDCVRQYSASCSDCVVTHMANVDISDGDGTNDAVVIDISEFAALRRLQSAGLVPRLRHQSAG